MTGGSADVLIAGGGIAGSALAILLGRAGLRVELFERGAFPREKPCGEGLMPAGVAVLERLGLTNAVGGAPFRGVRYHFGSEVVVGAFPRERGVPGAGLGQRRVLLDRVLFESAAATAGVRAHTRARVESPVLERGRVAGLVVHGQIHRALLVVAADGVRSPLRRALGLDVPPRHRRVGVRAHFRLAPGAATPPWVDVFLGDGHELYVTPLPERELLVAALADESVLRRPEEMFERWWRAQPGLAERLRGASRLTPLRGVAPLESRARRGSAPGIVLLGDAAGFLDPVTGGGMTQALQCAELLARFAARGVDAIDWVPRFERARRALLRDYTLVTGGVLWLVRHPALAAAVLRTLRAQPALMSHLVGVCGGVRPLFGRVPPREARLETRPARTDLSTS